MKNIILIAPPGAGKGTQASMLTDSYNMVHISVGDLLREEIASKSALGESLDSKMKTGKLIEDEIIFEVMKKRFSKSDIKQGIILDGFPRNLNQAHNLDKLGIKIDAVIYLDVPKEELELRI